MPVATEASETTETEFKTPDVARCSLINFATGWLPGAGVDLPSISVLMLMFAVMATLIVP